MTDSRAAELRALAERHLWMPYSAPGSQGRARDQIRVLDRGRGIRAWDVDGRDYLDGTSALEALILGHGDPEVVEAISRQARELSFIDGFRFVSASQGRTRRGAGGGGPGHGVRPFHAGRR